ncbi:MAG: RNA-binding S4 domain-containing protein [Rhizobiaceae bacterium]|nr:RNA-binding S4 domain-containing protein [Rhizobiaceae bacterium]
MATGEQRIDKWLFFARVSKSRSLAQKLTASGAVRVNREKTTSVAKLVRAGDVLTLSLPQGVKLLKVLEPGVRRGPASEAALLYEDLTPPVEATPVAVASDAPTRDAPGYTPSDRPPTKRERRALGRLKGGE